MKVLVDTNVLLRSVQKNHPASRIAIQALITLYRGDNQLCLATQNIAEFWNVCTRPVGVNGLGLGIEAADRYTRQLEKFFVILPDSLQVFQNWRKLIVDHGVIGVKVHDARLVAVMKTYDIPEIVTFNVSDFARFDGIKAKSPESMLSARI